MADDTGPQELPELAQPLEYVEPSDMNVIAGMVPTEGASKPTLFLQVVVPGKDGEPITMNYSMNVWDCIKVGLTMASMAVGMTEAMAEVTSSAAAEPATERKRVPNPYL